MILLSIAVIGVAAAVFAYSRHRATFAELRENPGSARADKVMLITLPSGRTFPVNYLRDPGVVYAAADSGWWKELAGDGVPVTLLIKGEDLRGTARAVEDDPELRSAVFQRLRPTAPLFFGTLIEIRLDS